MTNVGAPAVSTKQNPGICEHLHQNLTFTGYLKMNLTNLALC